MHHEHPKTRRVLQVFLIQERLVTKILGFLGNNLVFYSWNTQFSNVNSLIKEFGPSEQILKFGNQC